MAWAFDVVIGKYQVVQDLKDSNESEGATLFLCAYHISTNSEVLTETDVSMVYNRLECHEKKY